MDTTITVKMTPDEHRLIRETLVEVRDEAKRYVRAASRSPQDRRAATEKQARLDDLLAKL